MITAAELALMQSTVTSAMDQTFTLQRATAAADGYGTSTATWTTIATGSCSIAQPTAGQMQKYAERIGDLVLYQVRLPYGTGSQLNDHVIVGGQTLVVEALLSPRSNPVVEHILATEVR
jgi:hypothetical protein